MPVVENEIGGAGLKFFGKMSASISHEMKNVLAIINENAGLLKDLTLMAEKGLDMNPQQVGLKADKIRALVNRGDGIIKKMNRFAHSIDQDRQETDLNQLIKLMIGLTERLAAIRAIKLELAPSSASVIVTTSPFHLENLVCLCLEFILDQMQADGCLTLAAEPSAQGGLIRFRQTGRFSQQQMEGFPDDATALVADFLQVDLGVEPGSNELAIALPAAMGSFSRS